MLTEEERAEARQLGVEDDEELNRMTTIDLLYPRAEDHAYDAQEQWIKKNCGPNASQCANYGWGVDEVAGLISTKVYGHGVLTTDIETCEHFWDPY